MHYFFKNKSLKAPPQANLTKSLSKMFQKPTKLKKKFLGPYDPFRNKIYQTFVFYLPTYIYISIISLDDQ